ncbi:hypothetical protein VTK26DRAFT_8994 [Humicola hyalothermophila]
MTLATNIALTLAFPKGDVDLQDIAKVRVRVPLKLISSMDSSAESFTADDQPADVERKANPALKVINDSLGTAISGDKLDWAPNYGYIHVEYHFKVPAAISFTMLRQKRPGSDWSGKLAVKVDCGEALEGDNNVSCEVRITRSEKRSNKF